VAGAARLGPAGDVPAAAVFGSLFEFPARIGAMLGGGSPEVVTALREFGRHCGHAHLHAEDVLAIRGERTRLDSTLRAMLGSRISAIPEYLDTESGSGETLDGEQSRIALAAATAAGHAARRTAADALVTVPGTAAARMLRQFIDAVAAPFLGGR
jgi:geranylgeranyl pyrophosphate synthase